MQALEALAILAARIHEAQYNGLYDNAARDRDDMRIILNKRGVMRALCKAVIADGYRETILGAVVRVMPCGKYGAYHVKIGEVSANRIRLFLMRGDGSPVFGDRMPSWRAGKAHRRHVAVDNAKAAAEIREILWDLPLSRLVQAERDGGLEGEICGYEFRYGEKGGTASKDGYWYGTGRAIKEVLNKRLELLKPQTGLKVSMRDCIKYQRA